MQGCQKEPAAAMRRLVYIEGIKSYKPEVKSSKSDKRLRSYGHLKFCMFSYSFPLAYKRCSRLLAKILTSLPMECEFLPRQPDQL